MRTPSVSRDHDARLCPGTSVAEHGRAGGPPAGKDTFIAASKSRPRVTAKLCKGSVFKSWWSCKLKAKGLLCFRIRNLGVTFPLEETGSF